jgi:hypothetical protein
MLSRLIVLAFSSSIVLAGCGACPRTSGAFSIHLWPDRPFPDGTYELIAIADGTSVTVTLTVVDGMGTGICNPACANTDTGAHNLGLALWDLERNPGGGVGNDPGGHVSIEDLRSSRPPQMVSVSLRRDGVEIGSGAFMPMFREGDCGEGGAPPDRMTVTIP